jgi:hypothetical protein
LKEYALDLLDRFVNGLDHQFVYRRMAGFSLDLPPYHKHKADQQLSYINQDPDPAYYGNPSYLLAEILGGLDYPLWGDEGMQVVSRLRELNPSAGQYLMELHGQLEKIGHATPDELHQAGEAVRDGIVDYGVRNGADRSILDVWRQLTVYLPK